MAPADSPVAALGGGRLPDFVVIGAKRPGTTSLHRRLIAHPLVGGANRKEVHDVDPRFERGVQWYRAQFPSAADRAVVGEASAFTLLHPDVPERLRATLPGHA